MTLREQAPLKLPTIESEWLSYMDLVVPSGAPAVQIQESKRAFVAGAYAVLALVTALGTDDVSEADGVERLERLHRECEAFVTDALAGRR